tara:strand:- start:2721 stop:3656 length:936 start_codon:yes stop_codon:yes gene_type:complete
MKKPVIGITIGDYNGIGPEVVIKSLRKKEILKKCYPIIIGDKEVINLLKIKADKKIEFYKSDNLVKIEPGKPTRFSGQASLNYISTGIDLIKNKKIDCLVTAPISKNAISLAGSKFKGHTDLLQKAFNRELVVMSFFSKELNVSLASIHIPLNKVSKSINKNLIIQQILVVSNFLKVYLKKNKPRIGICGMNPHASEQGRIGDEDLKVIIPAVKKLKKLNINIEGPFPSDTIFVKENRDRFDIIHSIYHDQGLIPFKMLAFDKGVNVTLNLPFIRTSPDHGTAYDIAWKNKADSRSMEEAILLAAKMNRCL